MGTNGVATAGKVLHSARAYDLLVWVLTLGRGRSFGDHLVQLAQVHSGHSIDVDELTPALEAAALQIVERGPVTAQGVVGLPNLRFILGVAPSS